MAQLPEQFPAEPEQVIASFAFTDIAEGTGTEILFGILSNNGTVNHHLISTSDVFSVSGSVINNAAGTASTDFDTSVFNLPRTVRGTAYFSVGMGVSGETMQVSAQIKKVLKDGAEINLTSKISGQRLVAAGEDSAMNFIPLPITATGSNTIIKKGESLRLTIDSWNLGGLNTEYGADPKDSNSTNAHIIPGTKNTTVMKLLMPFRIDL